jgi:Leucine-rich repeat (LRR) protein
LEKLTGLTSLYLSRNQISDWRFLENLTGLTSLDLSSNQISDGRFLEKLTGSHRSTSVQSNQRLALFGKIDGAEHRSTSGTIKSATFAFWKN